MAISMSRVGSRERRPSAQSARGPYLHLPDDRNRSEADGRWRRQAVTQDAAADVAVGGKAVGRAFRSLEPVTTACSSVRFAADQFPEVFSRIRVWKGRIGDFVAEEAAERLPAVGDVEHQQALRRDRGAHLLRPKAVGGDCAILIGEFSTECLVRKSASSRRHTWSARAAVTECSRSRPSALRWSWKSSSTTAPLAAWCGSLWP